MGWVRSKLRLASYDDVTGGGGGAKGPCPPQKILENIVTLCFERHLSKQNSAIRLKSNILAPKKFWAGYATV